MMFNHPSLATLIATSQYLCSFAAQLDDRSVTICRHLRALDGDDALAQMQDYITREGFQVLGSIAVVPM